MSTRACVRCWEHKLQENFGAKQFKWSNDAPTCLDCADAARAEEYWEWKAQAQDRTCGVCANGLIAAQELRPGLEVRLRALVGSPELNGQYGRLLEYHEPTRSWPVLIATSNGIPKLVKPSNIEVIQRRSRLFSQRPLQDTSDRHQRGSDGDF